MSVRMSRLFSWFLAALLLAGPAAGQTPQADKIRRNEIDQRREIAIRYVEVKNVRDGYGTTRNIRGQRIHPRTKLIVTLAVVGGLLTLVFIAVASDKS